MRQEDAEEYTQALGQVVAGGWRQVALGQRLGVPQALGLTVEDWVQERLGGYVRLSIPERREAVAELSEEGMSSREVGNVLGVGQTTVVRDRRAESNDSPKPPTPKVDREPDRQVESNDSTTPKPPTDAEVVAAAQAARIAAWADSVRRAIETLWPMRGHPVPDELMGRLEVRERTALVKLISTEGEVNGAS